MKMGAGCTLYKYIYCCCCSLAKLCPAPCDSMDCRLSDSSVNGISQTECQSGLPFPSPGDLSDSGIEPMPPALVSRFFTTEPPGKTCKVGYKTCMYLYIKYAGKASLVGSDNKDPACNVWGSGLIPGQEDPLEKGMATHSSSLTRKIPQTEEPGRLQSLGSQSQT